MGRARAVVVGRGGRGVRSEEDGLPLETSPVDYKPPWKLQP